MEQTLLKVENLEVKFKTLEGMQTAVQGVSFDVAQGEVFCLVGESGCGKSLTSLSIMGLVEKPGIVEADAIILDGQDISHLKEEKLRELRGNKMSMIFQEPLTSLNPLFTVGNQMDEVFRLHQKASRAKAKQMSVDMLRFVGIPDPEDVYEKISGCSERRHAPACDDRHGSFLQAEVADCRRAHHRAGRNDPKTDLKADEGSSPGSWVRPSFLSHMILAWWRKWRTALP